MTCGTRTNGARHRRTGRTDSSIGALRSRTRLIDDEAGNEIGFSSLFHAGIRGALVQSIAGGNTMVSIQKLVVFSGAGWTCPHTTGALPGHFRLSSV